MSGIVCFSLIGCFLGIVFTLLFINFDSKWKIVFESVFGIGGASAGIPYLFSVFQITEQSQKFHTVASYICGFMISVIVSLFVMCHLIKDKDDTDVLRIRDILLGQKSYIKKYYDGRMAEIDQKLDIKKLREREEKISIDEEKIKTQQKYLDDEWSKINEVGNKKISLALPEKAQITLTKDYLDVMPSYINDIFKCVNSINDYTKLFLQQIENGDHIDITKLKSYFISVSTYISSEIFGGNANDVRIHFRCYNKNANGYEMFTAIVGSKANSKSMTFIPFAEDSLIKRSYECKRALIKSINVTHDYRANNYNTWQDYMTYTFYNLKTENGIPYLSFGISVKNAERYKKLFYFINFFMLEDYLRENIELVDDKINIAGIIYGGMK